MAMTDGFWMTAFTAAEQARVLNTVRGPADDGPAPWVYVGYGFGPVEGSWITNWASTMPPGVATNAAATVNNRVFALSAAKVWTYFGELEDRRVRGRTRTTDYSLAKGGAVNNTVARLSNWWTRSAGRADTMATQVDAGGHVTAVHSAAHQNPGARPALTVDIGS